VAKERSEFRHIGFGLAEGGEFKVQMFILVQMLNRITDAQI